MANIQIVFDGPPSHESGRFVEVEQDGKSICFGEWKQREDGYWVLELPEMLVRCPECKGVERNVLDARNDCRCNLTKTPGWVPPGYRVCPRCGGRGFHDAGAVEDGFAREVACKKCRGTKTPGLIPFP